ncbi:unnamed protein product [Phytophthora lilii]|uniref:Unnamed protein product n=1 Tax=Phytophthora lilii TaxID=2077276 RepID=A0A9W6TVQ9_9STRA|nr:unnamed protein product [Phytophthora lilii]
MFYIGDIIIFVAWYAADFPELRLKMPLNFVAQWTGFPVVPRGLSSRHCLSSGYPSHAWAVSVLSHPQRIRRLPRISLDFQFSSRCAGGLSCDHANVIPRQNTGIHLLCVSRMCVDNQYNSNNVLNAVPKLFRLKEVASSSTSASTSMTGSVKSRTSLVPMKPGATNLANISEIDNNNISRDGSRKSSQKYMYQVKPPLNSSNTSNNNNSTMGD